jgi:hypothetical protein
MLQARATEARNRAPRFDAPENLIVTGKTIGTSVAYQMSTENISRSGMLLSWEHKAPVPFIENTILELTIDPHSKVLDLPVSCLGRVVRKVEQTDDGQRHVKFGIRIVQIDNSDLDSWENCIFNLSSRDVPVNAIASAMLGDEEVADTAAPAGSKKRYRNAA